MVFPVPLAPLKIDLERQVWLSRLVSACLPVSILDAYDHFYAPIGPKLFYAYDRRNRFISTLQLPYTVERRQIIMQDGEPQRSMHLLTAKKYSYISIRVNSRRRLSRTGTPRGNRLDHHFRRGPSPVRPDVLPLSSVPVQGWLQLLYLQRNSTFSRGRRSDDCVPAHAFLHRLALSLRRYSPRERCLQ